MGVVGTARSSCKYCASRASDSISVGPGLGAGSRHQLLVGGRCSSISMARISSCLGGEFVEAVQQRRLRARRSLPPRPRRRPMSPWLSSLPGWFGPRDERRREVGADRLAFCYPIPTIMTTVAIDAAHLCHRGVVAVAHRGRGDDGPPHRGAQGGDGRIRGCRTPRAT